MNKEILINVTPHETRVAVVEGGVLNEFYVERTSKRGLVGNIFIGKVSRVLPGMQSAFIDIGLERTGFLHISDIIESFEDIEDSEVFSSSKDINIDSILKNGQDILVQVVKDPLGSKGARLTTRISIPSRYLVFVPHQSVLGISQKIEDKSERDRLCQLILRYYGSELEVAVNDNSNIVLQSDIQRADVFKRGGFIVRTVAEGIAESEIYKDIDFLHKLWSSIQSSTRISQAPSKVYDDLPLEIRTMRDLVHSEVSKVLIDSRETYDRVIEFTTKFIPEIRDQIEYFQDDRPIMDMHSIEDEIQKSLDRKIQLKSGGHLVIDQTEAMTTIDVNTGAFVGYRNYEETIYKTNLEASQVIARQLKLRNLGGIIIIDYIDMKEPEHRKQVLHVLEKHLEHDHSKHAFSELTSLGLVQLTRQRTRESLEHLLCDTCPTCIGRGTIKTTETVCYEIFREIQREVRQFEAKKLLVVASQPVIDMLMTDLSAYIAETELLIGRPISLQVETMYSQEQYDIVPL